MKKPRTSRVELYFTLTFTVSALCLLALVAGTLLPVVREYRVINLTDEVVYVTPLLHSNGDQQANEEETTDTPARLAGVYFAVLSQFASFSGPALPALNPKDLPVPPKGSRAIYIDYEDLKQEDGAQVLLVRSAGGQYRYLEADFWEQDRISSLDRLAPATGTMLAAHERASAGLICWLLPLICLALTFLFPVLLIRETRNRRREKRIQAEAAGLPG
ncbi:hypothetical protein LJY25_02795 [Hymenobacter sp. BT175]|uniref:hypothetical protein n=1 Tax=Hymenobacter translucens TaxID=2886507 RepID=UPI001D0F03F8|nr:hypothetical protein [Hymenobacter translucens]MCC2545359.1 hypothetical protein [Hymenobacter translucens]